MIGLMKKYPFMLIGILTYSYHVVGSFSHWGHSGSVRRFPEVERETRREREREREREPLKGHNLKHAALKAYIWPIKLRIHIFTLSLSRRRAAAYASSFCGMQ